MSTRENILAAIKTNLVTATVASGRVYRSRQDALKNLPAVIVSPESEPSEESVLGMLDRTLSARVAVYASGDQADTAADAILGLIETTLLSDRTLGLGSDVQLLSSFDTSWDFDEQDTVRATITFQISYRTAL